jgi:thiol-disulfide isomerase/thioredoxin
LSAEPESAEPKFAEPKPAAASNPPSRRHIVLSGLAGAAGAAVHRAPAAPADAAPSFSSGHYQFTIIRPAQELPSIRLFGLDGRTIDLQSLRGTPIVLNFWASWCAACRTELPVLERLHTDNRRGGLHVLAVSEDRGTRDSVERFVGGLHIPTLPLYWDPHGYVAYSDDANSRKAPFALYGMPITYLVASSGQVIGYIQGAADWASPAAADLIAFLRST